jgi:oligosaccharide repeat unit polymerase
MFRAISRLSSDEPGRLNPAAAQLWWLRPAYLVLLVIVPVYISFLTFDYDKVVLRRYVPSADYAWGLALLIALGLGAALGTVFGGSRERGFAERVAPSFRIPAWFTGLLLLATLIAYIIWFGPLASEPQIVFDVFTGDRPHVRDVIQTLPGITTLTQCGPAFVVLVTIKRYSMGGTASWERAGIWLVFALAIGRAFLWAERLAVMEIVVAWAVTTAAFYRFDTRWGARLAVALPVVAPLLLALAFAATEYFRSWQFYQDYYDSIWEFTYERLMTYYAVATNSGIGLLQEVHDWPRYTGRFIFEWAYTMPGLGDILIDAFGDTRQNFDLFLLNYGDEEFSNPSGLFPIVYDVGYFGSALYFFTVGVVIGLMRRSYARKQPFGLMFYPFAVLFILEVLRFNYLAAARFVPVAGSLAVALFLAYQFKRVSPWRNLAIWRKT